MAGAGSSQRDCQLTVDADVSQLGRLRNHVAQAARETGASDDIVEQLELVVSELATNAIQYDGGQTVTVVISCDGSGWTLDVSNADRIGALGSPTLADPAQLSGRGLFIVDAIMDRVELVDADGGQHIRCVKYAS